MQVLLVAHHTHAGDQNRASKVLYVSEHKTQYILIHAPYTRTVFFDILVTYTKDFIESNLLFTPMFYIAAIFVKCCYTTSSWLFWLIS